MSHAGYEAVGDAARLPGPTLVIALFAPGDAAVRP
jgi:hypothetical protein